MTNFRIIKEKRVILKKYIRGLDKDQIYELAESKVFHKGARAWVMVINPKAKDKKNNCIAYPVYTKYVKFVPNEE